MSKVKVSQNDKVIRDNETNIIEPYELADEFLLDLELMMISLDNKINYHNKTKSCKNGIKK